MKSSLLFFFTAVVWAQSTLSQPPASAPPELPPDTVVATFGDGQKLTAGELKSFLVAMPPNMAQAAARDRRAFVQQFALMHRLSEMAVKDKLDKASPTRESLEFNRMFLLMNAELHEVATNIKVQPSEVQTYYDLNKSKYKLVKVKAIYVRYGENQASEADALAKIAKLRADAAAGGNFVKLVKENSEDQTSAAKDGDFGTIRSTDNLPEAIRNAIFALKTGEVSQPVKQPNGFYLFRAEDVTVQPFAEVQEDILKQLKDAHFKQWMDAAVSDLNLKIQDQGFFSNGGAVAAGR